jgi:type II secretory pathway pseudopilin PulG
MLMRRKAFTLIELLLVIGVLIILIGITVWALKGAGSSASGNATKTTLENLTNMSEELNRKNKLAGFDIIYPPPPPSPPAPPLLVGAEVAPGLVTSDSKGTDRFGPAVQRTAEVMGRLTSIPDNKRILEKLPSDQLLSVAAIPPYSGGTVVLDGWKNPILFVPSTGLANVHSKQTDTYSSTNYSRGARVIFQGEYWTAIDSTSSAPSAPSWFQGIRSPDGRAFWASAGPDGAFGSLVTGPGNRPTVGSGDDNVYSFEH